ncbi:MAG: CYTH domain-containing protein [Dorea sp.]|nr:CYTH domain-containing protein [Dorea sp.]MDE7037447.1 CYTH domain-containing protein [Lachnospiraceae bacterium]
MEIERKYLIHQLPEALDSYPCRMIEQGYLNTDPVIRIRKDNDSYELTYKSKGLLARQEYNLPLTANAYAHLLTKIDGRLIKKKRYMIPLDSGLTAELDIFEDGLAPLKLVEVEFPTLEAAGSFIPPSWFAEDVTYSSEYHNSNLSKI